MAENNNLSKQVADLLDVSVSDAAKKIKNLSAEDLINLESAVDAEDMDAIHEIWDADQDEDGDDSQEQMNTTQIKSEIQRLGKKNLETDQPMDSVWELIGKLSESDWKLMWPAIDQAILKKLVHEVNDEDVDKVSAPDAQSIYDYAQDLLSEHVIYQNAIVEVAIPRGPNNTIGIRTNRGITMVNKKDTQQLDEHVLGMTQMPTISRMLELAGVSSGKSQPVTEAPTDDKDRIYIKGGAGSTTRSMMPIKVRRMFKDFKDRLPDDLANLESELVKDDIDYDWAHHICQSMIYSLKALANNLDSARKE